MAETKITNIKQTWHENSEFHQMTGVPSGDLANGYRAEWRRVSNGVRNGHHLGGYLRLARSKDVVNMLEMMFAAVFFLSWQAFFYASGINNAKGTKGLAGFQVQTSIIHHF